MDLEVQPFTPLTAGGASSYLKRRLSHISECADSEARSLLRTGAGLSWAQLAANPERRLSREAVEHLEAMLARRLIGEPLAYVVGRSEFCGLLLAVDKRALIPRPETELMAELVRLIYQSSGNKPHLAIDLGTGSGCLALALAHWFADCTVVASDISLDALSLARANMQRVQLSNVYLIAGDRLAPFGGRFDLIVANLPYVPKTLIADLPDEVREYEPVIALDGGADGLDIYRSLLDNVASVLDPDGVLVAEMDETNVEAGHTHLAAQLPGRSVLVIHDQFRRKRFLVVAPAATVLQAARSLNLEIVKTD